MAHGSKLLDLTVRSLCSVAGTGEEPAFFRGPGLGARLASRPDAALTYAAMCLKNVLATSKVGKWLVAGRLGFENGTSTRKRSFSHDPSVISSACFCSALQHRSLVSPQ